MDYLFCVIHISERKGPCGKKHRSDCPRDPSRNPRTLRSYHLARGGGLDYLRARFDRLEGR